MAGKAAWRPSSVAPDDVALSTATRTPLVFSDLVLEAVGVVPGPQPPSMAPELAPLGETARMVRGSTEWLESRAPLRRMQNSKSEPLCEVKSLCAGTTDDWEWLPAVLEADLGISGHKYAVLDGLSTARSVTILRDDIRDRVRTLGSSGAVRARAFCFLCGKEPGVASLPFHFQKCLQFWDSRTALPSNHMLEMTDPRALPRGPGAGLER